MEFQHCWAIVLRHLRLWIKDPNLITITLYWPFFDILIWGFLGAWIQQSQTSGLYQDLCLFSILLWQVSSRGTVFIVTAFLEEIWASNLINLFSLPLRLSEWIGGIILFAALAIGTIVFYCMLFMFLFYKISLLASLHIFIIFAPALFLSALWIGFSTLAILAQLGKRAQELAWIFAWLFSPLCGVFYPLEVLPLWLQKISYCIPMTYVFAALRGYILQGINPASYLFYALILALLYACISIGLFIFAFNRSKNKGLARLSD